MENFQILYGQPQVTVLIQFYIEIIWKYVIMNFVLARTNAFL